MIDLLAGSVPLDPADQDRWLEVLLLGTPIVSDKYAFWIERYDDHYSCGSNFWTTDHWSRKWICQRDDKFAQEKFLRGWWVQCLHGKLKWRYARPPVEGQIPEALA
jgi:hypothetical protein